MSHIDKTHSQIHFFQQGIFHIDRIIFFQRLI